MDQESLLRRISEVEFVCVDLNEYVDTHPNDKKARADLLCYANTLASLKNEYEKKYGPLLNFGHSPADYKNWVCSKWPWQL